MPIPKALPFGHLWAMRIVDKLQNLIVERGLTQSGFEAMVGPHQ
jgi:hypothetical protein